MNIHKYQAVGLALMGVMLLAATTAAGKHKTAEPAKADPAGEKVEKKDKKAEPKLFEDDPEDKADKKDKPEINPDLFDEFADLARVTKMDCKQQEKLLDLQKAKLAGLEKWDEKNERKITRAEDAIDRTRNDKKRCRMEEQLKRFLAGRDKLAEKYFYKALSTLSIEQLTAWNGHSLWCEVARELYSLKLDGKQQKKGEEICNAFAKKFKSKKLIAKIERVRNKALQMVARKVLTGEQKREFARQQKRKQKQKERDRKKKNR